MDWQHCADTELSVSAFFTVERDDVSNKLLELKNISKTFGQTKALSNVTFDLERGEVHCLVGENGAGKSTLIKTLAGLVKADGGTITMEGKNVVIASPNDAQALGISVVHQELNLCNTLTVAENIFLGSESVKGVFLDKKAQNERAKDILADIDPTISPSTIVETLSTGKKQIIEIARAVSSGKNVIIFDEPTSSLSESETEKLYEIVETLKKKNIGIIYISHRLDEIYRLGDRVTVLRDGTAVGTLEKGDLDRDKIVAMMVGRSLVNYYIRDNKPGEEIVFEANNVTGALPRNASFYLKKGEILGFSGLVGAGRTELFKAIFGTDERVAGSFKLEGKVIELKSPAQCVKAGITYVPEDRKVEGLFLDDTILFNTTIGVLNQVINKFRVDRRKESEITGKYAKQMKLKASSYDQNVRALSGGNQQKVLLGRWLSVPGTKVLILDEPTRGVDVGAKADIYKVLDDLTAQGYSIIIISSELQEIVGMCDRVYVMRDGRIEGCLDKNEISQVSIMKYALGEANG